MHRFSPMNWIQWLTLALIPVMAILVALVLIRIQDVQSHQNDALDSILCHAERVVRTSPGVPAKQRIQALKFYEQSIHDAHLKPCDQ